MGTDCITMMEGKRRSCRAAGGRDLLYIPRRGWGRQTFALSLRTRLEFWGGINKASVCEQPSCLFDVVGRDLLRLRGEDESYLPTSNPTNRDSHMRSCGSHRASLAAHPSVFAKPIYTPEQKYKIAKSQPPTYPPILDESRQKFMNRGL